MLCTKDVCALSSLPSLPNFMVWQWLNAKPVRAGTGVDTATCRQCEHAQQASQTTTQWAGITHLHTGSAKLLHLYPPPPPQPPPTLHSGSRGGGGFSFVGNGAMPVPLRQAE